LIVALFVLFLFLPLFLNPPSCSQAIGIALESRDLDILNEALKQCGNLQETLQYTLDVAMNLVLNKQFRNLVLRILVDLYQTLPEPDYESTCRCLVFLNDPDQVITILHRLLDDSQALSFFFSSILVSFLALLLNFLLLCDLSRMSSLCTKLPLTCTRTRPNISSTRS